MTSKVSAALACAGRIADPFVEAAFGSSGGMLADLVAWGRQKKSNAASARVIGELNYKWMKNDWNQSKFVEEAVRDYSSVFSAITTGQVHKAKPLVTEQMYVLLKRGIQDGIKETGCRQGANIIQSLATPTIVQARSIFTRSSAMRMGDQRPDFVQLTLLHSTLQQPVAAVPSREERGKPSPSSSSGYVSEGEAETAPRSSSALLNADIEVGEWVPVADKASGSVYWYNTATQMTTWTAPLPNQLVPRVPFRIETCGRLRQPVTDSSVVNTTGLPHVKVSHYVVWERSLKQGEGKGPGWRIAKM